MEQYIVKVKSVNNITYNVLSIITERPPQFTFEPGQATTVAINKNGWEEAKRQFTFASTPNDNYLEFIIKTYPSHKSVTNELLQIRKDDELILNDVFGAINYKGTGVFIAGGAGVTPFISILRHLKAKNQIGINKLIFANHTKADIILEEEFKKLLNGNFINILANEVNNGYPQGQITYDFLKQHCGTNNQYFYVCGPPPMMETVTNQLASLEVEEKNIVKEVF